MDLEVGFERGRRGIVSLFFLLFQRRRKWGEVHTGRGGGRGDVRE
jgi:hypothetical protein